MQRQIRMALLSIGGMSLTAVAVITAVLLSDARNSQREVTLPLGSAGLGAGHTSEDHEQPQREAAKSVDAAETESAVVAEPLLAEPQQGIAARAPASSEYLVLRDEIAYDTPMRAQIEIDILIREKVTKDEILGIVRDKYNEAIRRKVFRNREIANSVIVSAYPSLEHYHSTSARRVASMMKFPAFEEAQIEFSDVLHRQMFAHPEVRHGFTDQQRMDIYKEYLAEDSRAWDEAREKYPTDPDLLLSPGVTFTLVKELTLMGENDGVKWFEQGMPSKTLLAGTRVTIVGIDVNNGGMWAEVAAYPPDEVIGYRGWLNSTALAYQHPILSDKSKHGEQLERQSRHAEHLVKEYVTQLQTKHGISHEILEDIYREGSDEQWPWPD